MMNKSKEKPLVILAVTLGVLLLPALLLYLADETRTHPHISDIAVSDVAGRIVVQPISAAPKRNVPLASVPWKRDCDTLAPVVLPFAQLPWFRRTDGVMSVSNKSKQSLPESLSAAYVPVYLPTMGLPWRY